MQRCQGLENRDLSYKGKGLYWKQLYFMMKHSVMVNVNIFLVLFDCGQCFVNKNNNTHCSCNGHFFTRRGER